MPQIPEDELDGLRERVEMLEDALLEIVAENPSMRSSAAEEIKRQRTIRDLQQNPQPYIPSPPGPPELRQD